jgi:zinc transport system substrate-binding protein
LIAVLVGSLMLLAGCGDDSSGDDPSRSGVEVVAAFYPLAEAAARVGGDPVDVTNLTSAGAEPHDLELTTGQVDAIEDAAVVFVMGDDFQPAVEDAAERRADNTVVVLDALDVVDDDPHVWLDPVLMAELVEVVLSGLETADPGSDVVAEFRDNADAYVAELEALDDAYVSGLANCARTTMVTAHDAFGYLAARYGLTVEAIAGISPDEEPNPDRLAELSDLVEEEGVTTIFTEELVSPEIAETLAREAGGLRTAVLNPLEGLTDEQVDAGDDYISVMEDNLAELREALGCS